MADRLTRRELMKRALFLPVVAAGAGVALTACGDEGEEKLSCTDTSGLSAAEISVRETQQYVDSSPQADKTCDNCRFFQAPQQENTCGTCQVIRGPIHPKGYCKLWAAQS